MIDNLIENKPAISSPRCSDLPRLLREVTRDFEHRVGKGLAARGYPGLRSSHLSVFTHLGGGNCRVSDLARRNRVTQQAMGKMLKELERAGYVLRDVELGDKRAKAIHLTPRGAALVHDMAEVVAQVRESYVELIGARQLDELESLLRDASSSLNLAAAPPAGLPRPL